MNSGDTTPAAVLDERLRRLTPEEFRDVIGHFASGVAVVTAHHDGSQYGTTASAVTSLSLEPPMVLICLNKSSETGKAISATGCFAINILGEGQADVAVRFSRKGRGKFRGVPVAPGMWGEPLLADALATLECRVTEETTGGTHWVFLAEVDRASARTGTPLAYFRGEYGRLELAQDESAFRDVRDRVLNRDIPAGQALDIDTLVARLGIPHGPLFHALSKLTGEGLVARNADGAFVVRPVTFAVLEDALHASAAIEIGVATLKAGRLSAAELTQCRRLLERLRHAAAQPGPAWFEALSALLEHMVSLAGSDSLLDAYRRVDVPALIARARNPTTAAAAVPPDLHAVHARLLEAYERGDVAAAVEIIRRRNDRAIELVRAQLAAAGGEI